MNGLKYIRTRCNLFLNSLASTMGITRQALSMWENGKKEIPEQRKEQLAHFFGIEKAYFGEITELEKKVLLEKAMFRYKENGRRHTVISRKEN
ncbi:MAG: helix-turn-helix transcriptional regulator [Lachnospiraceae bacterium]|nr:helix-turn-helix transcriptional regulator [Lachnospiraceae bacterium]